MPTEITPGFGVPKSGSDLSVLVAPAHYQLDPSFGSEFLWAWELTHRIACRVDSLRSVAGTVRNDADSLINAQAVWPRNSVLTHPKRLGFVARYGWAGWKLSRANPPSIIHHMLPFALEVTFNPLALLPRPRGSALVIGPIQGPLSSDTEDERAVVNRVFDREIKPPPSERFMRLGLPVIAALSRASMRNADVLIAVSDRAKQLTLAAVPTAEVYVIPPGVDTVRFSPDEFSSREFEIIMVNYLVRRKRVDLAIEALAILRKEQITPTLKIIGEGPERKRLEKIAADCGVEDQVVFCGLVPNSELPEHYRRSSIFCLVSESEGAATVPLEAMASGLPLVTTDAGIMKEIHETYDVGELVIPNPESIAKAFKGLILDHDRRQRQSHNARSTAVAHFDWNLIASRYIDVYQRAVAKRQSRLQGPTHPNHIDR